MLKHRDLLALTALLLAPTGQHAFQQQLVPSSRLSQIPGTGVPGTSRLGPLYAEEDKKLDIDDVTKETADALKAAEQALQESAAQKARAREAAELQNEAIASAVGGAAIGTVLGGVALLTVPDLADSVPLAAPSIALGVTLAGASYAGATREGRLGKIVRTVVGKSTIAAGDSAKNAVKRSVDNAVDEVKAVPGKIADAAKNKVDETVEEIKQIPTKAKDAAIEAAEDLVDEIKATPGRVADSAQKAADRKSVV